MICPHCNGSGEIPDFMACRKLRLQSRKSLRQVAESMGYTASYLSDLELGRRQWSAALFTKFKAALNSRQHEEGLCSGGSNEGYQLTGCEIEIVIKGTTPDEIARKVEAIIKFNASL